MEGFSNSVQCYQTFVLESSFKTPAITMEFWQFQGNPTKVKVVCTASQQSLWGPSAKALFCCALCWQMILALEKFYFIFCGFLKSKCFVCCDCLWSLQSAQPPSPAPVSLTHCSRVQGELKLYTGPLEPCLTILLGSWKPRPSICLPLSLSPLWLGLEWADCPYPSMAILRLSIHFSLIFCLFHFLFPSHETMPSFWT